MDTRAGRVNWMRKGRVAARVHERTGYSADGKTRPYQNGDGPVIERRVVGGDFGHMGDGLDAVD